MTFDNVHKPKHYNSHPSGIECISITRSLSFNLGNAYKYLFRRDHKNNTLENLEKALWYLNDEIEHWTTTGISNSDEDVKHGAAIISEHEPENFAKIMLLVVADNYDDVLEARTLLAAEIDRLKQPVSHCGQDVKE